MTSFVWRPWRHISEDAAGRATVLVQPLSDIQRWLVQVLCAAASARCELQEEEVRPYQPAAHQEEDQVMRPPFVLPWRCMQASASRERLM